ncbi:cytochrome P450 [Streptomyces chlorus]
MKQTQPTENPNCPVVDYVYSPPPTPVGWLFDRLDRYQDMSRPAVWTEEGKGYWIFTDHDALLEGLQQADLWSSAVVDPTQQDPDYMWIPIMLDPPLHAKWRRLLGAWFTPARTKSLKEEQQRLAAQLIERLRDKGECDYVRDFAQVLPSIVFLQIMGMPLEKLDEFMVWEHQILHGNTESDPDRSLQAAGLHKVMQYFGELLAERRANPDPDAQDIVSAAITWEIDGTPIPDADLINCLLQLFMAGLDTVAGEASYFMYHLAKHPEDRRRIASEPELIPHAVEELLRVYPIVQTARKATRDADFHGCPVKAGQVAHFPLSLASRDEKAHPRARTVDLDRKETRHLAFGAGPHRCPGSHLGRQELAVMMEEWHRQIPDYELVEEPTEHGLVLGLNSLPLRWNRP